MTYTGRVQSLFHYPVKGLTAQPLDAVELEKGQGFPHDRMFGFARHDSGFIVGSPEPLSKDKFLMLMKDERLAGLKTWFDVDDWQLTIRVQGHIVLETNLKTEDGRAKTQAFFATMFGLPPEETPQFVYSHPHRFTDVSVVSSELMNAISLINLDSVDAFSKKIARPVEPKRFRGNLYFSGWPAFSELELSGRDIRIGAARAKLTLRTRRCAATEVNPTTAKRDMPLPGLLMQEYDHSDMGIYAEITEAGPVKLGDTITLIEQK